MHPHFLGRFGPNQPKEEGIQRESKQWHKTAIPCMQSREWIEGHLAQFYFQSQSAFLLSPTTAGIFLKMALFISNILFETGVIRLVKFN